MTASKSLRTALTRFRRTVTRTLRRLAFKGASATLTISLPPFIKLEIKAETEKAKPAHRRRRLAGEEWKPYESQTPTRTVSQGSAAAQIAAFG